MLKWEENVLERGAIWPKFKKKKYSMTTTLSTFKNIPDYHNQDISSA